MKRPLKRERRRELARTARTAAAQMLETAYESISSKELRDAYGLTDDEELALFTRELGRIRERVGGLA
jgi:ABC-type multidrug transport system fused ATPase/permease subunit